MRNFVAIINSVFVAFSASLKVFDELPTMLDAAGFKDVQDCIANTKLGALNSNK